MKALGFLVFLVLSHHGLMQIFRLTTYHRYFLWASPLLILYAALAGWLMFKLGLEQFFLYQVALASLWLVFVARQQSHQAELMLQLAEADSESVQAMATSVKKTKRYYTYSAFVYLGGLCLTYIVLGGGHISGLLDFSQDPLITPIAGWLASRSATGIIGITAVLYFGIGMIVARGHLSSGKVGTAGPLVTLLATILLWPVVVIIESRYK
jgi:hypothetical protein